MTEFTAPTETEAHEMRREMIVNMNASVSLVALDPARNLYVFDAITAPMRYDDVYPTAVHDMTTEALETELVYLNAIAVEDLDELAPIRANFIIRELHARTPRVAG